MGSSWGEKAKNTVSGWGEFETTCPRIMPLETHTTRATASAGRNCRILPLKPLPWNQQAFAPCLITLWVKSNIFKYTTVYTTVLYCKYQPPGGPKRTTAALKSVGLEFDTRVRRALFIHLRWTTKTIHQAQVASAWVRKFWLKPETNVVDGSRRVQRILNPTHDKRKSKVKSGVTSV